MKVAVIQHSLRDTAAEDVNAIVVAIDAARGRGADLVVLPMIAPIDEDADARRALAVALRGVPCVQPIPDARVPWAGSAAFCHPDVDADAGVMAVLTGDRVFDAVSWHNALDAGAQLLVLGPGAENDLQAEAALELALQLSDSVAGLVLVAECDGAEVGDAGHGGSAIISLGDIVAEAMSGDDTLIAEIALPIAQPEPREPLPELPTLLAQRLAHHSGAKVDVDYPADLSDGAGPD